MGAATLLFWTFAAMAVTGGLMAVLLPRIVHAVFSLMLSFIGVAGLYAVQGADFLAIVQLVVYVGGVLVLMAFGILLTGRTAESLAQHEARHRPYGVIAALLIFAALMTTIAKSQFNTGTVMAGDPTTLDIGALLIGDYIIAFEFASVLLLLALVGAAYLVRRAER
ncbi:MAG: NADH-quinone oxidoreductase subunit J [Planctomycetota bacterium]